MLLKKPKKNYWEERSRMSNIPKLRFPEFKGEWEEKKIIQFCEISAGGDIDKNNSQKEYSSSYPYSVYSNSLENKGLYGYANYYKIDSDVVTVTGRGDVGHAVARHEKFVPIVRLLVCKPKNNENVNFLENAINKTKIFIESTGVPQLTAPQLGNVKLFLPSLAEQQKIADFLSNVDSIITAETKILNTLQKKKKALMQKLFTRQLRFKSDDGKDFPAWEEKKVIDFAKVDTGANNTQDKVEDGPYPFYVRSPIIYRSNKYIFDFPEAVLTVGDGVGTGKVFHYVQGKFDCHQRVYVIHDFENVLGKYFYFYFSEKFYARVKPMSAKNSVDSVRREMITDMKIPIPCKAEQQKIADCLSSLDSLIQNQQKVVTTWQQRKKALLQQMFV